MRHVKNYTTVVVCVLETHPPGHYDGLSVLMVHGRTSSEMVAQPAPRLHTGAPVVRRHTSSASCEPHASGTSMAVSLGHDFPPYHTARVMGGETCGQRSGEGGSRRLRRRLVLLEEARDGVTPAFRLAQALHRLLEGV